MENLYIVPVTVTFTDGTTFSNAVYIIARDGEEAETLALHRTVKFFEEQGRALKEIDYNYAIEMDDDFLRSIFFRTILPRLEADRDWLGWGISIRF